MEATKSLSSVIKGYRVQDRTRQSGSGPVAAPVSQVVGGGRLPRSEISIVRQTAPVGPGAAAAGVPSLAPAVGHVQAAPGVQEQVDLLLARAQARADLMLRQAEERAELLIDQAVNGAQALVDEARQSGWQEGYEEGIKEGRQQAEALKREAEQVRADALAERDRFFDESREELVRLALTVAHQVIRQELQQDPSRVLPLVDEALARVRGEDQASLRLAPAAVSALEPHQDELAARHGIGDLKLVPDASLEPGDVQVQTPAGTVDARVERQMGALSQTLTRVVRHV